jgi:hypothetical protein
MALPYKAEQLVSKLEVEYNVDGNPIYVGIGPAGGATSDPVWRIAHIIYDLNGNPIEVIFADGTIESNKIWDNRAGYSYN